MASSVEKECGAASAVEEAVSLELPAPPGWKKKVHFSFLFFFFCSFRFVSLFILLGFASQLIAIGCFLLNFDACFDYF